MIFAVARRASIAYWPAAVAQLPAMMLVLAALPCAAQPRPDSSPRISVSWSGVGVRAALEKLAESQGFTFVLDRRVDPSAQVNVDLTAASPQQSIAAIAEACHCDAAWLGETAYVGPPESVQALRAMIARSSSELRNRPSDVRKRLTSRGRLEWEDLATPRELLAQLAGEAHLQVVGDDLVPHDLWAHGRVEDLPWHERLALVLVQFDLSWRLAPDVETLTIERAAD